MYFTNFEVKRMFSRSTNRSLMLLNETFSTTSFEEGYYIARDSVKALLSKGVRTIYNTHMHKLGADAEELTRESGGPGAASLIMRTEEGRRSFKVALARPEGSLGSTGRAAQWFRASLLDP